MELGGDVGGVSVVVVGGNDEAVVEPGTLELEGTVESVVFVVPPPNPFAPFGDVVVLGEDVEPRVVEVVPLAELPPQALQTSAANPSAANIRRTGALRCGGAGTLPPRSRTKARITGADGNAEKLSGQVV